MLKTAFEAFRAFSSPYNPLPNTPCTYRKEIEAFATFAGWDDVAEAIAHFLSLEDGQAYARADKIASGPSPASINRSMAALNSLVASARRHGITAMRLEAKGVKSSPYRDTKGPGLRGVLALLAAATNHKRPKKAARDAAIIRLAYGLGLRWDRHRLAFAASFAKHVKLRFSPSRRPMAWRS